MRRKRARDRAAAAATLPAAPVLSGDLATWCASLVTTQGAGVGDPLNLWPWENRCTATARSAGRCRAGANRCGRCGQDDAGGGGMRCGRGWSAGATARIGDRGGRIVRASADPGRPRASVLEADDGRGPGPLAGAALGVGGAGRGSGNRRAIPGAGSERRTLHGSAPSLIVADEPAQWQPTQTAALYSAIRSRLGKLPGRRLLFDRYAQR